MGLLRLSGFSGMWPIRDARALPENAAVAAKNIEAGGGAYLTPLRGAQFIKTLAPATQTVFRIPLPGDNTLANSYWMEFVDINTDVVRAPIVNDQYERIYWASPSTGLKYAPKADIIGETGSFTAGVPAPTLAPAVTPVAGTGNLDGEGNNTAPLVTRSYVVTFVSVYGEESQPGPTTEATGHTDQDWLIDEIPQPGLPGMRAEYETIRLYRTVTGQTGQTQFFKVVDLAVGTTFYTDRLTDTVVTGQGLMQSTLWAVPPEMDGIVAMPNGIFVGWHDNNLYFSENYRPHAWPAEYTLTVEHPIVGLGVFGSTCVVCTTGFPAAVSGIKASNMALVKSDAPLPCLSRRGIVSSPEGVYYPSEEGIVLYGPNGPQVMTRDLIGRDDWRNEYAPSTLRAMMMSGSYIAARTAVGKTEAFKFRPVDPSREGVVDIDINAEIGNFGVEPWTGKPWAIVEGGLYEWESPSAAVTPFDYAWMSREFYYPKPTNFSVFQAYFDDTIAADLHLKVWAVLRSGSDNTVTKTLVYDADITLSGKELRLPSGFKSDVWQVELTGNAHLQAFLMATTAQELRGA